MDRLTLNLQRIERLDVVRLRRRTRAPAKRPLGSIERPVVSTAIDAAARLSNTARLLQEVKELAETAHRVSVTFVGGRGPMIRPPTRSRYFTMGIGAASSAFAFVGVSVGYGLYGSNLPEFGLYSSRGGGIWSNVGVAGDLVATYVFGPPSKFGGISWGISVAADIPGAGFGISAQVLFGTTGPPFELLGFSYAIGAGVTALPVTVSLTASNTQLLPVGP